MPFTLAHAAAALPLRRSPLVFSALVFGTFGPDFEYFMRLAPRGGYGHSIEGLFVLTIPLTFVLWILFDRILMSPLIGLLPREIEGRLQRVQPTQFDSRFFLLVIASIALGALTHIAWDSFTHVNTVVYRALPLLQQRFDFPGVGPVGVYKLLQHGSSLLGLGMLGIACRSWFEAATFEKPRSGLEERMKLTIAGMILFSAAALATVRVVLWAQNSETSGLSSQIGVFVVSAISFLWLGASVFAVWWRFRASETMPS